MYIGIINHIVIRVINQLGNLRGPTKWEPSNVRDIFRSNLVIHGESSSPKNGLISDVGMIGICSENM